MMLFAAAMVMAAACADNAKIEGQLSDAPSSEVIVKLLNVNHYEILDTVKTEASGKPKEERVRDLLTWRYVQSGAVPSGAANKRAVRPQQCKRAVSCSSGKCWEEWEL